MVDGHSGIPGGKGEKATPPSAHTTGQQRPPCGNSSRLPLQVSFLSSGQPNDRQGRRGRDKGGHILPSGGACSILWQRFREQLVLSKAFLQ